MQHFTSALLQPGVVVASSKVLSGMQSMASSLLSEGHGAKPYFCVAKGVTSVFCLLAHIWGRSLSWRLHLHLEPEERWAALCIRFWVTVLFLIIFYFLGYKFRNPLKFCPYGLGILIVTMGCSLKDMIELLTRLRTYSGCHPMPTEVSEEPSLATQGFVSGIQNVMGRKKLVLSPRQVITYYYFIIETMGIDFP